LHPEKIGGVFQPRINASAPFDGAQGDRVWWWYFSAGTATSSELQSSGGLEPSKSTRQQTRNAYSKLQRIRLL